MYKKFTIVCDTGTSTTGSRSSRFIRTEDRFTSVVRRTYEKPSGKEATSQLPGGVADSLNHHKNTDIVRLL